MAVDVNTVVSYLNNIRSGIDQFENYLMAASADDQPAEGSPEFERARQPARQRQAQELPGRA